MREELAEHKLLNICWNRQKIFPLMCSANHMWFLKCSRLQPNCLMHQTSENTIIYVPTEQLDTLMCLLFCASLKLQRKNVGAPLQSGRVGVKWLTGFVNAERWYAEPSGWDEQQIRNMRAKLKELCSQTEARSHGGAIPDPPEPPFDVSFAGTHITHPLTAHRGLCASLWCAYSHCDTITCQACLQSPFERHIVFTALFAFIE